MVSLLHCGKRRTPTRRVDIHAPDHQIQMGRHAVNLKEIFQLISIYEFFCPNCLKMNGEPWHYAWLGHYFNLKLGKSDIRKIQEKHLPQWLVWIKDRRFIENKNGTDTVQGSQNCFPYRLVSRKV